MSQLFDPIQGKYIKYGGKTHLSRVGDGLIDIYATPVEELVGPRTSTFVGQITVQSLVYDLYFIIHSKLGMYSKIIYHLLPDLLRKELSTINLQNHDQVQGRLVRVFTLLDSCLFLTEKELEEKDPNYNKNMIGFDGASICLALRRRDSDEMIFANIGVAKGVVGQFETRQHYVTNPAEKERYFSGIKKYGFLRGFEEKAVEYNRITRAIGEFVSPMKIRGGRYMGIDSILSPIPDVSFVPVQKGDVLVLGPPRYFRSGKGEVLKVELE